MYNAIINTATGSVRKYGYCDFTGDYDINLESQVALILESVPPEGVPVYYCKVSAGNFVEMTPEEKAVVDAAGLSELIISSELTSFVDANTRVTDEASGITGPFELMQLMLLRKELYNDTDSPLHTPDFTPVLGVNGWAEDHAARVNNLETIHGSTGWHQQQITESLYYKPLDLLIYYGWLNSFNSATNGWNNEKVAHDMAQYNVIVVGAGLQAPTHGDYANTQVILSRIKALNPRAIIFGYVTTLEPLTTFQTKVDQWNTLGVHGIFMDEAGYDYGKNRSEFNARVDYIHGRTSANIVFANACNTDNVLGLADDASFPNTTYNSGLVESALTSTDWVLLESFPINTDAYTASRGYEPKEDWAVRVIKAINLRYTYGVKFAACGIINNDNTSGNALFLFGWTSALMASLDAFGTSDTSYASSSAQVKRWTRPDSSQLGSTWTLTPSIQVHASDPDVYWRYTDFGRMFLDFSANAQDCEIYVYDEEKSDRRVGTVAPEQWFTSPTTGTALTTGILTANRLYFIPFELKQRTRVSSLAINVTTLKAGLARVGIYDSNNGIPSTLLGESSELNTGSVGVKSSVLTDITLLPGLKFLALVSNNTATVRSFAVASLINVLGFASTLPTTPTLGYYRSYTYAALPKETSTVTPITAAPIPAVFVRTSR